MTVHFNRRNNEENLTLKEFVDNFCEYLCYQCGEVFFSENPVAMIKAIFLKDLIVFSDPIIMNGSIFQKVQ